MPTKLRYVSITRATGKTGVQIDVIDLNRFPESYGSVSNMTFEEAAQMEEFVRWVERTNVQDGTILGRFKEFLKDQSTADMDVVEEAQETEAEVVEEEEEEEPVQTAPVVRSMLFGAFTLRAPPRREPEPEPEHILRLRAAQKRMREEKQEPAKVQKTGCTTCGIWMACTCK
jgi:hypothetical protein